MEGSHAKTATALQRNQAAANMLSDIARQLRFSKARRSKMFQAAGLRPRLADRIFRLLRIMLVVLVIFPVLLAIAYFGVLASDQFESETRFTIRTSEPLRGNDDLAQASGMPSALIVQDTQIIANYVKSRALLERLGAEIDLRQIFGRSGIDWYKRLAANASIEDLLDYWQKMTSVAISPSSGIITVKVRAFSAEEAHRINQIILVAAEELVNDMNDRIWEDVTSSARDEVRQATDLLSAARARLQEARNDAGILTIDSVSGSLSALLTQLRGEWIALEHEYQSKSRMVSQQAPQMRVLASKIEIRQQQIADLQQQIASSTSTGLNLADHSAVFAQIELEQTLAENRLAASINALEQLQLISQQKLLYLNAFLMPTMPDDARFPRRILWIAVAFVLSLACFAVLSALLSVVRHRFD